MTNPETPSPAVVRFYNKRGTAEQWIKEGKQAVKMTRLSCHRFRSNQVRLALSLLAYNLGNLCRLALPRGIETWSLTSAQGGWLGRGLILGFGLWRGLMLDRLPVLGQPAPHALDQRNRIRSEFRRRHLTEPVLERARHVDLLPVAP